MYAGIKPNVIQISTDYTHWSRLQNITGLSFTADSIKYNWFVVYSWQYPFMYTCMYV